ncbi:DUF4496-containing protein [Aureococcus anophagefferens]|nr:DUF4496-containing protein [Aureococcus anophagefferens]
MDEVDHIIAEILTERKHSASKTSLLLETKKLREAWDALNAWILDRVIQRRGAAVPNFGKFTWQVLGGFTPADLDPRLAGKKAASKIPLGPVLAKTNGEIMRDSTDALLGMLPTKNHLKPSATYYQRDRDRASRSRAQRQVQDAGLLQAESSVADAAYERHLASIEHEANRIQDEKVVFQNLLAEGYAAGGAEDEREPRAQEYLQNQIDTKAVKHAREGDPEDELKEQEALGAISLKQPMRPMLEGPFKMYNITGFPTRGRAENIKVHELCDELARSIDFRKERVKSEREEVLEEERRFIRHVNDEMFKNKTLAKQKLDAANNELLRAWETSQHVKNLQRLQGFGADAMLSYAKPRASTVGFDPRDAAAAASGVPASKKGSSLMGLSTDSRKALIDA